MSLPKLPNQYYYVALSFGCAAVAVEVKAVPLRPHGRAPANCIKNMFLDCIKRFFLPLLVTSNDIVEIPNTFFRIAIDLLFTPVEVSPRGSFGAKIV